MVVRGGDGPAGELEEEGGGRPVRRGVLGAGAEPGGGCNGLCSFARASVTQ